MGHWSHHAIVVTSEGGIEVAHVRAKEIMDGGSVGNSRLVSEIVDSKMNGFQSFFVAPDGSKEGFGRSKECDENRKILVEWLRANHYDWVEVRFGGDFGGACVESSTPEEW